MKLKCNANYIEMGRSVIRFKDIEKIIYSEAGSQTNIHIFNAGTGKHIGAVTVSSDKAKDFIAGLSGYCNRYKLPFIREEMDIYMDDPIENYDPIPLDTFENRKRIVSILGRVLLFVLCASLALLIVQTRYMTVISTIGAGIVLMIALMSLTTNKGLKVLLGIAGLAVGAYAYSVFFSTATTSNFPSIAMFFAVFLPPAAALFLIIRALAK